LDGSFKENIAFGIESEKIDMKLVINAAEKSKISNFIDDCDDGYNTRIGEGGSLLSGGQVQRIGIARALYKGASILVFDEATSSLDGRTESEIIDAINNLDKDITIIVVTHSLSTLRNSDWVYKLDQGVIIKEGPPKSMLNEKL
jgi:ATP-binding cassette subfamily B protein